MKNSILIKRVILVFCMISIIIIGSGCAAKKAVLENQGKTECYLDEKDATKFIYNGQQYTILNNTVDKNSLGKGQILRPTPNTAPLICGACYNTQPEDLLTMA